jgi:flagellar basal body-associated protein FliL
VLLPTVEKKLRVMVDWLIDLLLKRDVARLKTFAEEERSIKDIIVEIFRQPTDLFIKQIRTDMLKCN